MTDFERRTEAQGPGKTKILMRQRSNRRTEIRIDGIQVDTRLSPERNAKYVGQISFNDQETIAIHRQELSPRRAHAQTSSFSLSWNTVDDGWGCDMDTGGTPSREELKEAETPMKNAYRQLDRDIKHLNGVKL